MPLNPLDWTGPPFLALYAGLLVLAFALAFRHRSTANPNARGAHRLSPLELAFLAGGRNKAADTALLSLLSAGAATLADKADRVAVDGPAAARILERYPADATGTMSRTQFIRALAQPLAQLISGLAERGLLLTADEALDAAQESWLTFGALALFGLAKIAVGISRGRPVGFLVMLVIVTVVSGVAIGFRTAYRTREGRAALAEYRLNHARAARAPLDSELMLAFALTGPAVLAGTPYAEYGTWLRASSGSSGDGSGSGCGGGDGGGGCGGCGG